MYGIINFESFLLAGILLNLTPGTDTMYILGQSVSQGKKAEILHRTINYLKQRNKKVYLVGHSYGASICLEYIASRNNLADKVVIMGTDFDDDISSWSQLKPDKYIS
ncbi:alpha/beta fold hydrolase [Flavobacterium piscinae]|uniref:alpha/beta fold hydrolase n=1 Tax=Flavobacterium piscinae TaxID=2506424 RepID=UPI0013E93B97|nr:alpha/beta fold hydrolase [Flavobacterium piscinae]MBC8884097.1 alpha/beta fold hydrolase [Flavobacterium piscinae]